MGVCVEGRHDGSLEAVTDGPAGRACQVCGCLQPGKCVRQDLGECRDWVSKAKTQNGPRQNLDSCELRHTLTSPTPLSRGLNDSRERSECMSTVAIWRSQSLKAEGFGSCKHDFSKGSTDERQKARRGPSLGEKFQQRDDRMQLPGRSPHSRSQCLQQHLASVLRRQELTTLVQTLRYRREGAYNTANFKELIRVPKGLIGVLRYPMLSALVV